MRAVETLALRRGQLVRGRVRDVRLVERLLREILLLLGRLRGPEGLLYDGLRWCATRLRYVGLLVSSRHRCLWLVRIVLLRGCRLCSRRRGLRIVMRLNVLVLSWVMLMVLLLLPMQILLTAIAVVRI